GIGRVEAEVVEGDLRGLVPKAAEALEEEPDDCGRLLRWCRRELDPCAAALVIARDRSTASDEPQGTRLVLRGYSVEGGVEERVVRIAERIGRTTDGPVPEEGLDADVDPVAVRPRQELVVDLSVEVLAQEAVRANVDAEARIAVGDAVAGDRHLEP